MKIQYTCHQCSLVLRDVTVGPRIEGQTVVDWVNYVRLLCSLDHRATSPECMTKRVDLKIPMPSDRGIGFEKTIN